ncbi:winged helix-turn-helix domain-containing protein [Bradyrhizobium sp. LA2.1]|uniref:ATP-binding protein n=1 Tax=Bradyrhizobium sp. LA2.1 TaxID=3156376 RepID=UPI003399A2A7
MRAKAGFVSQLDDTSDWWAFGPYRLNRLTRQIEKDGREAPLGGRALDVLIALIDRAGEIVSKKDLLAKAWPGMAVDEASLRVQVAALRKSLGHGIGGARYITNISGRGYSFVAPVSRSSGPGPRPPAVARGHDLPPRAARMVGRQQTVEAVVQQVTSRRFVTLVGPGGIGKTTVAIAAADSLRSIFSEDIYFIDLSRLTDEKLIPSVIGSAFDAVLDSSDSPDRLVRVLRAKTALIVLDCCEHLLDMAAEIAEKLYLNAPSIHIITTSRETLRVEGEYVHQIQPLEVPGEDVAPTSADVMRFSAVQLFVDKATSSFYGFELQNEDAPLVSDICRKLDGVALAIELAASCVDVYGVRGIAEMLDDRLKLLTRGRRTALPRHQTLRAMLDWSFALLSVEECVILRPMCVFKGGFSLEAAAAVVACDGLAEAEIAEVLARLVRKSLVSFDGCRTVGQYRLMDTTRFYLREQLAQREEEPEVRGRHARHYLHKIRRPLRENHAQYIDDVRAALDWTFSDEGDAALGVELAAEASLLFIDLALLAECRTWAERGRSCLTDEQLGTQLEMKLQTAFGCATVLTQGNGEVVGQALRRALELAEKLGDLDMQFQIFGALHLYLLRLGSFKEALELAQQSKRVSETAGDTATPVIADRLLGLSFHMMGKQSEALRHFRAASAFDKTFRVARGGDLGIHSHMRALCGFARALWLNGCTDEAIATLESAMVEARSIGHPVILGFSLLWMAFVPIWNRDWDLAGRMIDELHETANRHSLVPYQFAARGLKAQVNMYLGSTASSIEELQDSLASLREARYQMLTAVFASALAEGLFIEGKLNEALTAIDWALDQAESNSEFVQVPEMLRIKALTLASGHSPDFEQAERLLQRSIELAEKQSSSAWATRAKVTLQEVRELRSRGHSQSGCALGETISDR